MDLLNITFDVLGILISIIFIWLTIRSSKSLVGSIFRRYYRLMAAAAILFGLGFLIEALGEYIGFSVDTIDIIHHILLIIAAIMFVYAGVVFPKEAEEATRVK